MEEMYGYCGLLCSACPAFLATQAGYMAALEKLAADARKQFDTTITVEQTMCDGCPTTSSRLCGYCSECGVRACARSRGVVTCAHCDDYGCETLIAFIASVDTARANLEAIRARL